MIRVGLVDFDTSHVVAFTQRLNHIDISPAEQVSGARVVAGWPGDSAMMPERIGPYLEQLRAYGIEIVDSARALIPKIDAVMIESQQGSRHRARAKPFLDAGLPVFVDKPFAASLADVDAMFALASRNGVPLMSCSALRYDPQIEAALKLRERYGAIVSADVWTSAALHPGNPGLLHYGIHGVEMLYALLGSGCRRVRCFSTPQCDTVVGEWRSGQTGVVRGIREGAGGFGLAAHYERGHYAAVIEGSAYYRGMLRAVVGMFASRKAPIAPAESREIIAFILAALRSSQVRGAPRPLE